MDGLPKQVGHKPHCLWRPGGLEAMSQTSYITARAVLLATFGASHPAVMPPAPATTIIRAPASTCTSPSLLAMHHSQLCLDQLGSLPTGIIMGKDPWVAEITGRQLPLGSPSLGCCQIHRPLRRPLFGELQAAAHCTLWGPLAQHTGLGIFR